MSDNSPSRTFRIGIVTVTYNSEPVLSDFLSSLSIQTHTEFILYAIDNASTDRTAAILRSHTGLLIRLISNSENLGVAEGNNHGIRQALNDGCDYVLLLNNDVVFPENLLSNLLEGLRDHACDLVAPKIYYHDQPKLIWAAGGHFQFWLGRALHIGEGSVDVGQFDQPCRIAYAPTCCVLIRRRVFEQIGLMDSRYFVYWDDVDFMYRAYMAGLSMWYLPRCMLFHKVGSLTAAAPSQFGIRYSTRNRIFFVRKFFPEFLAGTWIMLYRTYLFLRYITRMDSKGLWQIKESSIKDGLKLG